MNHIVTLDSGAKEIENLITGTKSMIIHGADVKRGPYGKVAEGDVLYFVTDDKSAEVKAKGLVSSVYNSYQLTEAESFELIIRNQDKLTLPDNLFYKWAGKKYLVLIGLRNVEEVQPFLIDRSNLLSEDGWCPAVNVENSFSRNRKTA
jgi:hypothetical protein